MTSKYASFAKKYDEETTFTPISDKVMNFLNISKKNPTMSLLMLQDELLPIPMHDFVEVSPGTNRNFICRGLINEECPFCDGRLTSDHVKLKPKKTFVGQAVKFKSLGRGKTEVEYMDYRVRKQTGDELLKKYPDLKYSKDDDSYTFEHLPTVGIFFARKTVNDQLPAIIVEWGDIKTVVIKVTRTGERLETKYSVQGLSEPEDIDLNSQELKAAVELSKSVDEYIDDYISADRIKRIFSSSTNAASSDSTAAHQQGEDPWKSVAKEEASEEKTETKPEMSDEEVDAKIAAMFGDD